MHIGSALLAIWLFIGGIAAGQRGAVTILAGPLNYAGVNPDIRCTVRHPSN